MKNKLKVYRATHDLTQEQLADKLGVTRQTVIAGGGLNITAIFWRDQSVKN